MAKNQVYLGERIESKNLILGRDGTNDILHRCTEVIDCAVEIVDADRVGIWCTTFRGSRIKIKRKCRNRTWAGCVFDSCIFKGDFFSCYFGLEHEDCALKSGLRNCDFSHSKMNLCCFFNCSPDDLRLPPWPHITIFNPRANAGDFNDLKSSPVLWRIKQSMENESERTVAMIYHLPSYVQMQRKNILALTQIEQIRDPNMPPPSFSIEEIRELLSEKNKPYVRM